MKEIDSSKHEVFQPQIALQDVQKGLKVLARSKVLIDHVQLSEIAKSVQLKGMYCQHSKEFVLKAAVANRIAQPRGVR